MPRSFSNSSLLSAYLLENISIALKSRGYAASAVASEGEVSRKSKVMFGEGGGEGSKAAWVPDPKTGYYRPEIVDDQVDAAELRQLLLNHKNHPN